MPRVPRVPVGSHVPVTGGLVKGALAAAHDLGAEAIQVFVGNPRGWALSEGDPRQDAAFRTRCEQLRLPVVVHTPYLVNLGSPTPSTLEHSIASVRHNLRRAGEIGAVGAVVHTGSCVDAGGYDLAMKQVREGLLPVLDELDARDPRGPLLLLEPTAGQGQSLCAGIEDLPAYLGALDHHPRVGICLDTCHVFAAGAPLDRRGGMTTTLDRLVELTGPARLRVVHANDSQAPIGSLRDRHERIGRGHIGTAAFRALLRHQAMRGVPVILETPGGKDAWRADIELLKQLRRR